MEGQGENELIFGLPAPLTVNQIYADFVARRAALINALTIEYHAFCLQCDDFTTDGLLNLCLYGHPNKGWEVINNDLPVEGLPEPPKCLGAVQLNINMKATATGVANHSDAWLLTVVNYFCNRINVAEADRQGLLNRIAQLPRLSEVVAAFEYHEYQFDT